MIDFEMAMDAYDIIMVMEPTPTRSTCYSRMKSFGIDYKEQLRLFHQHMCTYKGAYRWWMLREICSFELPEFDYVTNH